VSHGTAHINLGNLLQENCEDANDNYTSKRPAQTLRRSARSRKGRQAPLALRTVPEEDEVEEADEGGHESKLKCVIEEDEEEAQGNDLNGGRYVFSSPMSFRKSDASFASSCHRVWLPTHRLDFLT
jgi:hypothetical protein